MKKPRVAAAPWARARVKDSRHGRRANLAARSRLNHSPALFLKGSAADFGSESRFYGVRTLYCDTPE